MTAASSCRHRTIGTVSARRALRGALARKRGDNDVLPLLARECETATSDYLEDPMGVIRQVGADYRVLGHRSSSLGTLGTKRACSAIPGLQARPVCSTRL